MNRYRSILLALVLGPLLAAVPAGAQVPAPRPGAALPADTLRSSAVQQLGLDDGRLVVTIEQGKVGLPDGLYRSEEGAQFTVRDGRIAAVRPAAAPLARPGVPRQPVRPVPARGIAVTAAEVRDGRLLLRTADGGTIALADGAYASEDGVRLDIRDGRPVRLGFPAGFRLPRLALPRDLPRGVEVAPDPGARPPAFQPSRERPVVVVLVHGKTDKPDRRGAAEQQIATRFHPLYYWGFDFMAGLLGTDRRLEMWKPHDQPPQQPGSWGERAALVTAIDAFRWNNQGRTPEQQAQIARARTVETVLQAALFQILDHQDPQRVAEQVRLVLAAQDIEDPDAVAAVRSGDPSAIQARIEEQRQAIEQVLASVRFALGTLVTPAAPVEDGRESWTYWDDPSVPALSVLLTYRDGAQALGVQAKHAIDQIYEQYNAFFGDRHLLYAAKQPEIVLVTHSKGGLVSRYLLSSPEEHAAGHRLTREERRRAEFIRERTRYLVTIATPHEGSPIADLAGAIHDNLASYGLLGWFLSRPVSAAVHTDLTATWHLTTDSLRVFNRGPLAPHRARRPDGSLIPIYALTGRTPTAGFFSDPEPFPPTEALTTHLSRGVRWNVSVSSDGIEVSRPHKAFDDELARFPDERTAAEAYGLMFLDFFLHLNGRHWGEPPAGSSGLDRTRRVVQTETGVRTATGDAATRLLFPTLYLLEQSDGRSDHDGLVGAASGLGVRLGTAENDYFSSERMWTVAGERMRGSWYRLPTGPWDWQHHGSIMHHQPTSAWIRQQLLARAGPYVGPGERSGWSR